MQAEGRRLVRVLRSAHDAVRRLCCPQQQQQRQQRLQFVSVYYNYSRPSPPSFTPPLSSMTNIIDYRAFHFTATHLAPKKRRVSASSARKKKQREVIKEQKAKEQRAILKRGEKMKSRTTRPRHSHRHATAIPDPLQKRQKNDRKEVPRAFLTQTGSTNVYIAKCAVMDETTGEMYVDPKSLFSEIVNMNKKKIESNHFPITSTTRKQQVHHHLNLPHTFKNSHLHYFPPSSFPNFEPPSDGCTPEVAFLGRSNTGKSSLINALSSAINGSNTHLNSSSSSSSSSSCSGGGELARTSKRPGRTQTINYFGLISNNHQKHNSRNTKSASSNAKSNASSMISHTQSKLYFIDLPGFGYASAPDESVDEWQKKTQEFLISRASSSASSLPSSSSSSSSSAMTHPSPPLKRLYLLLDSRLSDPTLLDLTVMGWCDEYAIPYTLVLTKVDASSRSQCVKLTNQLCMRYHSLFHHSAAAAATTPNTTDEMMIEAEEESGGGEEEVYMDPVVYWTSAKERLGMEELLLSIENNMFDSASLDEQDWEYVDNYDDDDDDEGGNHDTEEDNVYNIEDDDNGDHEEDDNKDEDDDNEVKGERKVG